MPLRLALDAMGTRFEFVLDGGEPCRPAGEEALERVREAEARLSAFRRDSLVSRLNEGAGGPPLRVDDELLDLLEVCTEVHAQSGGAFDPSIGALMEAWGFRAAPPAAEQAAACAVGFDEVRIDRGRRTVQLPSGMRLDLGAIGKGWALDRAAEVLREAGVRNALLHGGTSTMIALGSPPGEAAWRVAVRDPDRPGQVLRTAELRDSALSVSALHGRTATSGKDTCSHVMDPRRRRPAAVRPLAAAAAASATLADAWSTALLVLEEPPRSAPLTWTLLVPPAPAPQSPTQQA